MIPQILTSEQNMSNSVDIFGNSTYQSLNSVQLFGPIQPTELERSRTEPEDSQLIDYSIPGNRLIQRNGSIEIIPKSPAFVFGEWVIRPIVEFSGSVGSHVWRDLTLIASNIDCALTRMVSFLPTARAEDEGPSQQKKTDETSKPRSSTTISDIDVVGVEINDDLHDLHNIDIHVVGIAPGANVGRVENVRVVGVDFGHHKGSSKRRFSRQTSLEETESPDAGERKRSDFGKETISQIDCLLHCNLQDTTCTGKVNSGTSTTTFHSQVGEIKTHTSATLFSTICERKLQSGTSTTATHSQVGEIEAGTSIKLSSTTCEGKIEAGTSIMANQCDLLGSLKAGTTVELLGCTSVLSINSKHVILRETTVQGDVTAEGSVIIESSKVKGTLTCSSDHLIVRDSQIDTIYVHRSSDNSSKTSSRSEGITWKNGVTYISTNSRKVFKSSGKNRYNTYLNEKGVFIGGGEDLDNIRINGLSVEKFISSLREEKEAEEQQIVELLDYSEVKNVIFEGGHGSVVYSHTSTVTGDITGGTKRSK